MDPINWHSLFFLLFAGIACSFALAVVFASNVVRMAFFLIISLAATAGLFFLAGADFVGAMQLVLYVGGTLVLLVFGVMLTAQSPFISIRTAGGDWVLAALVGGSMLAILVPSAILIGQRANEVPESVAKHAALSVSADSDAEHEAKAIPTPTPQAKPTATRIGQALIGVRVEKVNAENSEETNDLSGYVLGFEIISIHLLVVLVGAAYLARSKRRVEKKSADG